MSGRAFLILWVCLVGFFFWGGREVSLSDSVEGFALCFYLLIGISMGLITIVSGQIFPFLYHVIKSLQNTYVLGRES